MRFAVFMAFILALAIEAFAQPFSRARRDEGAALEELRRVSNSIPSTAPWQSRRITDPFTEAPIEVVETNLVRENIARVQVGLLQAVEGFPELESYIKDSTRLDLPPGLGEQVIVRASEADQTWASVRYVATLLASLPSLAVELEVRSSPVQPAHFKLVRQDGSVARETATNATLTRVWRGAYTYTLTATQFKTATGTLDLVTSGGGLLDCSMVPNSSPSSPVPCRLVENAR